MTDEPVELTAETVAHNFIPEIDANGLQNTRFLPLCQRGRLTRSNHVEQTIKKHCLGSNVNELVDYSTANPTLFLTCVLINRVSSIPSFLISGLTDQSLPVEGSANDPAIYSPRQNQSWDWDQLCNNEGPWEWPQKDTFLNYQWLFFAVIFKDNEFSFKISKHPLPYKLLEHMATESDRGHSGEVHKVGVLMEHLKFENGLPRYLSLLSLDNGQKAYEVAVKKLRIQGVHPDKLENYFNKEKDTLLKMRELRHEHLIEAVAVYEKGVGTTDKYFVFPWANGGNLRSFWRDKSHSMGGRAFVSWALHQMTGLADGLAKLHNKDTRHGDVKPENILHFKSDKDSEESPALGTLVLADVGIAKFHAEHTSKRRANPEKNETTNEKGTQRYEPPEMEIRKGKIFSRKVDAWSMGCVLLELIIWLLHGSSGQEDFDKKLLEKEPHIERFWDVKRKKSRLHPVAKSWIKKLRQSAGRPSALGDLLYLVEHELLVVDEEKRASSERMCEELARIEESCSDNPLYLWGRTKTMLTERRETTTEVARDNSFTRRSSNLMDRWDIVANTDLASWLLTRLDGSRLQSLVAPSQRLCDSCAAIDFESSTYDLQRSLGDLQNTSSACFLCQFLYRRFSANGATPEGPLTLHRDGSTIRTSASEAPSISLYCNKGPDSNSPVHSYAQLGLPLLPEVASDEQFTLLKSWIHICDDNHDCSAAERLSAAYGPLPTRVIDVGDGGDKPMRLIKNVQGSRGKYLAFSHRWGNPKDVKRFCTFDANIERREKYIGFDELPKSFQDAVRVTRALHIQYLWIDSICIIQDNRQDWETESKKMEDVFSNAYCTIAASSAGSSLDGFLGPRTPRDVVSIRTTLGPLYLAEFIDDFGSHVENSGLGSRGWVLQERALSRRTIYFTNKQVYWECGRGVFCESLAWLYNPRSQILGDYNFPSLGLNFYKGDRIRLVQYLYKQYSALSLTKIQDRSKAILGLQKRIARQFESQAQYGILWRWLERTILWHAETPESLIKIEYEPENTVPSWSWMAYDGRIAYPEIPFGGVDWTDHIRHPTIPESDDIHWGGQLQVQSNALEIENSELIKRSRLDEQHREPFGGSWRCVVVGKRKAYKKSWAPFGGSWRCAVAGKRNTHKKSKAGKKVDEVEHYVLLIRPASLVETDEVFVRAGVATLLAGHISVETRCVILV